MSGRRRASDRGVEAQTGHQSEHSVDLDEQSLLGNQAISSRMHGGPPDDADDLGLARDVALPLVDRAGLALQVDALGDPILGRFREILAASALDPSVRSSALGRIETNEAMARDVAEAVRAVYGADSDEIRDQVARDLDAVVDALRNGAASEGGWRLPDGRTVEPTGEGSRAGNLVVAVGDAVGGEAGAGARILAFCQRTQLALMLDEEDEEEPGPDYGPTEST